MVAARQELNRVQYGGFDFDSLNDDLLARLQVKFAADFNDFALSSLGIVLLDLVSFGLDALGFYLDRRASDNFLQTARTRRSISKLTRALGYRMGGAVSSSADLQIAIAQPVNFSVPILQGRRFNGPDGLIFESAKDITFDPLSGPEDILLLPVYEGETLKETFVSDGSANQFFELSRVPEEKFIVDGTVTVLVDGSPFTEQEFLTFDQTDQYEFSANDDPPTIRFGDGTIGNIPTAGASVDVTYVASKGRAGQVQYDTITEITEPLVVNAQQIQLSITNPEPSVGGDNLETPEKAKAYAPRVYKSRHVAVTRGDYEAIAGSFADPLFGRVAVAQAISSRTAASDLTLQNLVTDITNAVDAASPTITAAVESGSAQLTIIDDASNTGSGANLPDKLSATAALTTTANNQTTSALSSVRTGRQKLTEILSYNTETSTRVVDAGSEVTTASSAIDELESTVSGITSGGSDELTADTQDALLAQISIIDTALGNLTSELARITTGSSATASAASDVDTNLSTALAALNTIAQKIADIGTDLVTDDTTLNDMSDLTTAIAAASVSARTEFDTIVEADIVVIDDVSTALTSLQEHVGAVLAADCKANLITVPILTKDAAGFFTGPSNSLVNSLQTYLDSIKEVSQTVAVTSGEKFLVPAVITVRVGVRKNFAHSVVKNAVAAAVDAVLRDRAFGNSLFESELDSAVKAVDGVAYWNVNIDGHFDSNTEVVSTDKLDAEGNLILSIGEIVTRASVRDSQGTAGIVVNTETQIIPS